MPPTKIIKIDPINPKEDCLKEASDSLKRGGLVIIPTETVYGIAANMLNKDTISRLYEIKKRPEDKPFSLLIHNKQLVEKYAAIIPVSAHKLMDKFWPGPLTLILDLKSNDEKVKTVGMRMPDNEIALRIISLAGVPIVCPSANISGKPAPVDFEEAIRDLNGLVDLAVDSGATKIKTESTIVDLTHGAARVLREGAIKKEAIEDTLNKKTVLFVCTGNSCRSVMAQALLNKKLKEIKRLDVEVLSAGTSMFWGLGATEATKEVLRGEGIDVSAHRSQKLTREMIDKSDIILAMEQYHEDKILLMSPEAKNRVFLLKEFAKINARDPDIADPIGMSMDFYKEVFRIIKSAIERIAEII